MVEITITSKKDGSEKVEKFPIDEGLYESTKSLSEDERKKFLTKEYRIYKREQKVQRKQVSLDEVDEAYDLVHGPRHRHGLRLLPDSQRVHPVLRGESVLDEARVPEADRRTLVR